MTSCLVQREAYGMFTVRPSPSRVTLEEILVPELRIKQQPSTFLLVTGEAEFGGLSGQSAVAGAHITDFPSVILILLFALLKRTFP